MPIWDQLNQNPMSAMILMSGLSNLGNSLSKQNLPARGSYAPGGYSQGGGMEDMLPNMLRVQAMQAQMQNQQQDNELQRKQFEFAQQTAAQKATLEQQRLEAIKRAVPGIVAATGQPAEVVEALLLGGVDSSNPLAQAVGDRSKTWSGAPGERRFDAQGNVIADNPALLEVTPSGFADRRNAIYGQNPQMHADAMGRGRAGATRLSVDARNMGNAAEGMQNALIDERKGLVGDIDGLRGEVESLTRATDMALAHPDWTGPLAETKADALRAKAAAIAPFGGELSPDESEFISFVDEFKEGKFNQTLKKVEKLTPVTEKEFAKAETTAIGAESPVSRIVIKGLRAKKQYEYAMEKKRFIDHATNRMMEAARVPGGPQFSPGRLQMEVEDWEKQNPFPMDSYVKELAALSQAYPVGGGKKGSQPVAGAANAPDDPLGLLTP